MLRRCSCALRIGCCIPPAFARLRTRSVVHRGSSRFTCRYCLPVTVLPRLPLPVTRLRLPWILPRLPRWFLLRSVGCGYAHHGYWLLRARSSYHLSLHRFCGCTAHIWFVLLPHLRFTTPATYITARSMLRLRLVTFTVGYPHLRLVWLDTFIHTHITWFTRCSCWIATVRYTPAVTTVLHTYTRGSLLAVLRLLRFYSSGSQFCVTPLVQHARVHTVRFTPLHVHDFCLTPLSHAALHTYPFPLRLHRTHYGCRGWRSTHVAVTTWFTVLLPYRYYTPFTTHVYTTFPVLRYLYGWFCLYGYLVLAGSFTYALPFTTFGSPAGSTCIAYAVVPFLWFILWFTVLPRFALPILPLPFLPHRFYCHIRYTPYLHTATPLPFFHTHVTGLPLRCYAAALDCARLVTPHGLPYLRSAVSSGSLRFVYVLVAHTATRLFTTWFTRTVPPLPRLQFGLHTCTRLRSTHTTFGYVYAVAGYITAFAGLRSCIYTAHCCGLFPRFCRSPLHVTACNAAAWLRWLRRSWLPFLRIAVTLTHCGSYTDTWFAHRAYASLQLQFRFGCLRLTTLHACCAFCVLHTLRGCTTHTAVRLHTAGYLPRFTTFLHGSLPAVPDLYLPFTGYGCAPLPLVTRFACCAWMLVAHFAGSTHHTTVAFALRGSAPFTRLRFITTHTPACLLVAVHWRHHTARLRCAHAHG